MKSFKATLHFFKISKIVTSSIQLWLSPHHFSYHHHLGAQCCCFFLNLSQSRQEHLSNQHTGPGVTSSLIAIMFAR